MGSQSGGSSRAFASNRIGRLERHDSGQLARMFSANIPLFDQFVMCRDMPVRIATTAQAYELASLSVARIV